MKLLFRGRKVHFVKWKVWSTKGDLVYEKKVLSQRGRFCLQKGGFIFVYSFALAYICYEMNKLRSDFLSTKGRFLSTKGRFYLRKEGFIIVYIVVLPYICYKINKLLCERKAWSTKGRSGL